MNPFLQSPHAPPARHRLGFWLGYRKLMAKAYVPSRGDRRRLAGSRVYQAVIVWSLAAEQTDSFFTVTPGYFGVWGLVGTSQQPEGVEVTVFDPERNRYLTDNPLQLDNLAGTAQHPYFFRSGSGSLSNKGGIYIFEPNTQILAKIANLSNQPNSGRLVLCGRILPGPIADSDLAPASAAAIDNLQTVQEPPWIQMPSSGEPFNPAASIKVPAIGSTATIVSHKVGTGRNGVVNRMANEVQGQPWVDGDGTLVWQFTRNGVPVKNQERIVSSLGSVNLPAPFGPFRVIENDVVALTVTNVAMPVAGQLIRGRFDGWDYPKDLG